MTQTNTNKTNLRALLSVQGKRIVIPMIQRDYAQGRTDERSRKVRQRFLSDLRARLQGDGINLDFVYGASDDKDTDFVPLDGQQRLTTLYLLYWLASRREGVEHEEAQWLGNFIYETRSTATYFCRDLATYWPESSTLTLEEQIREEAGWYIDAYDYDATACAMLTMLDELDHTFYPENQTPPVTDLWHRLDKVTFYCTAIANLGATDEIYIKMNSRGKPLTDYEHFKAELDRATNGALTQSLDTTYTDYMWTLNHDVDLCLGRFIRCVGRTIMLATDTPKDIDDRTDDYDLVATLWAKDNHIDTLRQAFDALIGAGDTTQFLPTDTVSVENPVLLAVKDKLKLSQLLRFHAFIVYLQHRDAISTPDFHRRWRQLRNLTEHSADEIRVENMNVLLREAEELILRGTLNTQSASFNKTQKLEEQDKLIWLQTNGGQEAQLAALENHSLLLGSIGTIGLQNLHLADAFRRAIGKEKVPGTPFTRAILALDDIHVYDNDYRISIGGGTSIDEWKRFFFPSADADAQQRKTNALHRLLVAVDKDRTKPVADVLEDIVKDYLQSAPACDWRYYLVRYPDALDRSKYGKFISDCRVLLTTSRNVSAWHWPVTMYALVEAFNAAHGGGEQASIEQGTGTLSLPGHQHRLCLADDGFEEIDAQDQVACKWPLAQNNGVDQNDRVETALRFILPRMD